MKEKNSNRAADGVWKLFEKTGNPAFYSLYSKLKDK